MKAFVSVRKSVIQDKHRPAFHEGVVVKVNHDQRYSTTPTTFAILKKISRSANIPLQVRLFHFLTELLLFFR